MIVKQIKWAMTWKIIHKGELFQFKIWNVSWNLIIRRIGVLPDHADQKGLGQNID